MGLDISIELLTLIMFGSLLALLMAGLPLAFVTGGLACVFLFVLGDARALNIVPSRIFPLMTNYQLSAIPLFIFMAAMLERAGIINDMFDVIYKVLGGVKGGLASATIIASTILAAMVGVIGAAVVTMGIIALAGNAEARLRPEDRDGLDHGGRHARHPDPALDPRHHLRGRGRTVGGRAFHRRGHSGPDALGPLHPLCDGALLHQSRPRPADSDGRARLDARKDPSSGQDVGTDRAHRRRPRRDLLGRGDPGGSGRHRHLRRLHRGGHSPPARLADDP